MELLVYFLGPHRRSVRPGKHTTHGVVLKQLFGQHRMRAIRALSPNKQSRSRSLVPAVLRHGPFSAGSGTVLASSECEAAQKERSRQSGRAPLVHGQRELLRAWAYSARFHTSSAFPPDDVRATPKVKSSPASLMIDHFSAIPFDCTTELWRDCYPRPPGARRADRGAVPSKAIVGLSRLRKTARISIKINIQPKSPRAADNEFHGNY
jgi:hypothetical protein